MKSVHSWLFTVLLLAVIFISGCVQQTTTPSETKQEKIKYVCQDGTTVENPDLCPKLTINCSTSGTKNVSQISTYPQPFDKFKLKEILDATYCGAWGGDKVSLITFNSNILTIEETGTIAAGSDWGSKSEFDCLGKKVKTIYDYLNSVDIKPQKIQVKDVLTCSSDCKIVEKTLDYCSGFGCLKSVTYYTDLVGSDFEKIANLEMSYSDWLAMMQLSG